MDVIEKSIDIEDKRKEEKLEREKTLIIIVGVPLGLSTKECNELPRPGSWDLLQLFLLPIFARLFRNLTIAIVFGP